MVRSTEVTQLKMGYIDADAMVMEAELLFEQCGELGKALTVKQLRPTVERLIEVASIRSPSTLHHAQTLKLSWRWEQMRNIRPRTLNPQP